MTGRPSSFDARPLRAIERTGSPLGTGNGRGGGPFLGRQPGRGAPSRRVLSHLGRLVVVISAVAALLSAAPAATADEPSAVALNEVNCVGTDWVEVVNRSAVEVSLAGW